MNQIAVLVDAGYFWVQVTQAVHGCKSPRESIDIDYAVLRKVVLDHVAAEFKAELLRVYWYDGPAHNGGKSGSHTAIEELDDFKLRLGTRNSVGSQKAVDGLIIADLIGLAQSKSISGAIVLSGDADLTPGVIAAQGLGIRVHLLSMGPPEATSPYLRAEADRKPHIDDATVRTFATAKVAAAAPVVVQPVVAPPGGGVVVAVPHIAAVVAGSAPAEQTMKEIAEDALKQLGGAEVVVLDASGAIPRHADGKLLYVGRTRLARELDGPEKRALRQAFKALLIVAS